MKAWRATGLALACSWAGAGTQTNTTCLTVFLAFFIMG